MPVGRAGDDELVHRFHVPVATDKLGRKPVEQCRVAGVLALYPEIFTRLHQPQTEVMLPHAVHGDACGERVFWIHQPTGQSGTIAWPVFIPCTKHRRGGRVKLFRLVRLIVLAAVQHVSGARLGQFVHHHHGLGRTGLRSWHGGLHGLDFHRLRHDKLGLVCAQVWPVFWHRYERRTVAVVRAKAGLVNAVEESEQSVKILLRDRVIFVVVTARAIQREAEKHRAHRFHAVGDVFDNPLVRDRAALGVDAMVAIEAGGDLREKIPIWQQVAGHLLGDKTVERHVVVERPDDPVAPNPHVAQAVVLVAVGVGVAGGLQPAKCHVLAVPWRIEQAIDRPFVGVRRRVGKEGVESLDRWRQSGEVERHPPQQGRLVGFRRRRELFVFKLGQNEVVDAIPWPSGVVHLGQARPLGWHECPVPVIAWPSGPAPKPLRELGPLLVGQRSVGFGWRHALVRVGRGQAAEHLAVGQHTCSVRR